MMITMMMITILDRAGDESIVSRGKAFRKAPYWVSSDDTSEQVLHSHTSVFELAQRMYEEKVFFREHIPQHLTQRPRDDKGHVIRSMLRKLRELDLCLPSFASAPSPSLVDGDSVATEANEGRTSASSLSSSMPVDGTTPNPNPSLPLGSSPDLHRLEMLTRLRRMRRESEERMDLDLLDDLNAQSLLDAMAAEDCDDDVEDGDEGVDDVDVNADEEMVEVFGKVASRAYFKHWASTLPPSLRSIYEEESRRLDQLDASPPPLGTLPLRDLVRTMHYKDGAVIKFL